MIKLLNELSRAGQTGYSVPETDVPAQDAASLVGGNNLRVVAPALPEVSESDLNRHFTRLSHLNYALTTTFYPLGSCTMKYNPPVNEKISQLPGLAFLHPYQPEET
ncbi:MAG: aminomethyl-transferring glycine dehydrogenase subunit GcvPB, partial [Endomicrobiales bacterium]